MAVPHERQTHEQGTFVTEEGASKVNRAPDGRRVVLEADDGVPGISFQSCLHDLHQRLRRRLAIQDQLCAKEPMPTAQQPCMCQPYLTINLCGGKQL